MSLTTEELAYGQSNYDEQQVMRQPTFANYPPNHYQSSEHTSQQQLPTQSLPPQHLNHQQVYSASAPAYQMPENAAVLGTSPAYQQHLSSINTQAQMQSLEQPNSFPVYQGGPSYGNKVIEMPVLQSSVNLSEGMYQQLQQQKIFATSTTGYNMAPNQSKNRYPWPSPKN